MNLSIRWIILAVLGIALVTNFGVAAKLGLGEKMDSDAQYFLDVARNLAGGDGYVVKIGYWSDAPSARRMPGWPFLISLLLRGLPGVSPDIVMRVACLLLNVCLAGLISLLTWRLFRLPWAALLAGAGYAMHPVALFFAFGGASEMLFLVLALLGTLLVLDGGRRMFLGFLALGLACLVRANFLPWIAFWGLLAVVRRLLAGQMPRRRQVAIGLACTALFLLPPFLWTLRNATVCGHFPVLSTLRGQTIYGGNNSVVANDLNYWGYWVFPDSIPGETPMAELVGTRSEYEVDVYYYDRACSYIRENWFGLPRLLLGKLVRAYVPVPWKPQWASYGVCAYRILLYLAAIAGVFLGLRRVPRGYGVLLLAMLLTNIMTVLIFWGVTRFAFVLDPFLLPFAGLAMVRALPPRPGKQGMKGN